MTKLENVNKRLEKLENSSREEVLTLVELLANANFFGQMKKALCRYAKNGQCGKFIVDSKMETLSRSLPVASDCRVEDCEEKSSHCHIELSSITCGLCHEAETSVKLFDCEPDQKINNQNQQEKSRIDKHQ